MGSKILMTLLAALMLAMSGCTDDSDDDGDDTGGGDTGGGAGGGTGGGDGGDGGDGNETEEETFETTYFNGTVTGGFDCQLVSNGQSPVGGETHDVPDGAHGETFTLSLGEDVQNPAATLCLYIDGESQSLTGTVPDEAEQFQVYANSAPEGVAYVLQVG